MVTSILRAKLPLFAAGLLILGTLSSCGLKKYLVSPPPPPKVVDAATAAQSSSGSGNDCGDWKQIFQGSETDSVNTFECYASKAGNVWTQIKGARPNQLTDDEVVLVLHRNLIELPGNRVEWTDRVMAIKSLMGIGSTLTKQDIEHWVGWVREHRADMRDLYLKLYTRPSTSTFYYTDSQKLALLGASLLRQLNWNKSSTELSQLILKAMPFKDWQFIGGMETGVRAGRNLLGWVCPLQSPVDHVQTEELAQCLENAQSFFEPTARWFEFMINNKAVVLPTDVPDIQAGLDQAQPLIAAWFANNKLKPIDTQLWFNWAKMIGANPPSDFIDSLKVLTRLSGKSTQLALDPAEMNKFFNLIHTYHSSLLNAITVYSSELQSGNCQNPNASTWKNCVLSSSRFAQARKQSSTIDNAFRVKNPNHGQQAVPFDGLEIDLISFFDATSELVMSMFDTNKTGVITTNLGDQDDEVVKLITTSVNVYRAIDLYAGNLSLRLNGDITGMATTAGPNLGQFDINGFSRLLAIASDVLVLRTPEQLNVIQKFLANITNDFPTSSQTLDRPAITAILTAIDALSGYRQLALKEILGSDEAAAAEMQANQPIPRAVFEQHIGDLLKQNFPRTYQKCQEFGFEISCQIAFAQVMPSTDDSRKMINPTDLDVLSILAMGLEGVFDNCGKGDGTLSLSFGNGDDQLDCGFTRLKDGVERLIDAKIIKTSTATSIQVNAVLNAVNSVFLTRTAGKVALARGTTDWAILNYLFVLEDRTATFGSSYALLSNILEPDQVKAIKNSKK